MVVHAWLGRRPRPLALEYSQMYLLPRSSQRALAEALLEQSRDSRGGTIVCYGIMRPCHTRGTNRRLQRNVP